MRPKTHLLNKPAESAVYWCMCCTNSTNFLGGALACSSCGADGHSDLVPIHMEDNSSVESFYTAVDWHGG